MPPFCAISFDYGTGVLAALARGRILAQDDKSWGVALRRG
jgi:hypothetical protein